MISKAQALTGTVFVSINPETGKCDHFYKTQGCTDIPARYRAGKCKTWKRNPDRWEMKLAFGGFNRNSRNYAVSDTHNAGFELMAQYLARQRFGFGPNTPPEIIADRLRDEGEDMSADEILGIPRRTAIA